MVGQLGIRPQQAPWTIQHGDVGCSKGHNIYHPWGSSQRPGRAYSKAMSLLKLPVGEKWYTSELKAHRLVLHRTDRYCDGVARVCGW